VSVVAGRRQGVVLSFLYWFAAAAARAGGAPLALGAGKEIEILLLRHQLQVPVLL
jgi:hypothetical protein